MIVATALQEIVDGQLPILLSIFLSFFCAFFAAFTVGVVLDLNYHGGSIRDSVTVGRVLTALVTAVVVTIGVRFFLPPENVTIRDAAIENVQENVDIDTVVESSLDRGQDMVLTLEHQPDDSAYTEKMTFTYNEDHGIMVPNAAPNQRDSLRIIKNSELDTLLNHGDVVLEQR